MIVLLFAVLFTAAMLTGAVGLTIVTAVKVLELAERVAAWRRG